MPVAEVRRRKRPLIFSDSPRRCRGTFVGRPHRRRSPGTSERRISRRTAEMRARDSAEMPGAPHHLASVKILQVGGRTDSSWLAGSATEHSWDWPTRRSRRDAEQIGGQPHGTTARPCSCSPRGYFDPGDCSGSGSQSGRP